MQRPLRIALSLALAGGVLVGLLVWSGIRPSDVAEAALRVDPWDLVVALALLVVLYAARAVRIRILLPEASRPPAGRLAAATAAWILDAQVLPAKVGEATLVWHLRRLGVPAAEGLVALLVSRLFDLAVLLGTFGVTALVLARGHHGDELPWLTPLGLALVPLAAGLGFVVARGAVAWRPVPRVLARLAAGRTGLAARLHVFSVRVGEALAAVDAGRRNRALAASFVVWALILAFYAVLARGLGVATAASPALGLGGLAFGASLAVLGGLVPASGFLGFGMLDVGWVAGFTALGVSRDVAVASGLAFHVLYLVGVGLLGVLGHVVVARGAGRAR